MTEIPHTIQDRWSHDVHWRCSVLEQILLQLPIPITIRSRVDAAKLMQNHAGVVLEQTADRVEPQNDVIPITLAGDDGSIQVEVVSDISPERNGLVRHMLESDSQGVWVAFPDGSTEYVNQKLRDGTGSHADGMLGWTWTSMIHPADTSAVLSEWKRCVSEEVNYKQQFRCRTAAGPYRWTVFSASPIRNANGQVQRYIGRLLDVDDERQLRQQIEDERALFETTMDQLPVSVVVAEAPEGKIRVCNRKTFEMWRFGLREQQSVSDYTVWNGFHQDGRKYEVQEWPLARSILHGEVVTNEECFFQRGDGTLGVIRLSSSPVYSNGRLIAGVVCFEDVTNQLLAEEQHARLLAAEHAAQATTDLMANVSHELRTPLNCVIGMTELLLETSLDAEQTEYVTTIRESGKLLLTVINDVLDHGKVRAGRVELESIPFELHALIQTTITLMREQARLRDVHLRCRFTCCPKCDATVAEAGSSASSSETTQDEDISSAAPVWLQGDPQRLQQIIVNLLSNAIRFTPKDGEVCVTVAVGPPLLDAGKRCITVEVSDTGIGIEASILPRLFQPFTQADSSTTRRYGGTGLGLAICKQLVTMMNGTINARSEYGHGSTFWFSVNLRQCDAPNELREDHKMQYGNVPRHGMDITPPSSGESAFEGASRSRMNTDASTSTVTTVCAEAVKADHHHQGGAILVAEDNPVNQLLVSRVLKKGGFTDVTVVSNGEEAVRALRERNFDVVLMDCQMPIMDGFEASRHIRHMSDPHKACVPIIALTASALKADVDKCIAAGMTAHIAKPYDSKTLLAKVTEVLPK